jgi:hypothetical protein
VRTSIEATVLTVGWLLGGTVGVGTLVYAFGIGPLVQLILRVTPQRWLAASGWAFTETRLTTMGECPPAPAIETTETMQSTPTS